MADVNGVEVLVVGLKLNKDLDTEREKKSGEITPEAREPCQAHHEG